MNHWSWELQDGFQVLLAGSDISKCHIETCKPNIISSKGELWGWVEYDPISATDIKPVDCLPETFFDRVCPEQCVVNTFGFVWDVRHNVVVAPSVGISRCGISLRSNTVPIAPPGRDERGQVAIFRVQWNTVVPIPSIKDSLLLVVRYWTSLVEWLLRVMCLTCGMFVEGLEVHSAPRSAIFLGANHHPVAPGDGLTNGYRFKHTEGYVFN